MVRRTGATAMAMVGLVATTLLLLSACHDEGPTAAATTTSAPSTTASSAPPSSTSTSVSATDGCPAAPGEGVPQGMVSRVLGDVDSDGLADTFYVGMGEGDLRRFGVVTASGHRSEWCVHNASPVVPQILGVVDADQDGRPEVFVNPGRLVNVLVFGAGQLRPYLNKDGQPYEFSIGYGPIGTGVGCIDADGDGHRDLVGLDAKDVGNSEVQWTRTIVTLHGAEARNGAKDTGTYRKTADATAITLLYEVTCGDDTFADPLTADPG